MKTHFTLIAFALVCVPFSSAAFSQNHHDVDVRAVMSRINVESSVPVEHSVDDWWHDDVQRAQRDLVTQIPVSLHDLLYLTIQNSAQVKVYSEVPLIRETAVAEAVSAFDWVKFAEGLWEDTDEPVGSSLTVGGTGNRFKDHKFGLTGGVRRRTWNGGELDISQRIGHQNTNSNFFIPNDQGTARLSLGFTQPLLRGQGRVYNQSLAVLAKIDVETASQEFSRQLQSHLMEVARGYWALYLERATLAQRVKLYLKTERIVELLAARQQVDAGRSQLISARAALENRRADLIRAQAAVKNAETRIRALVNAEELGNAGTVELIPGEAPTFAGYETDLSSEITIAVTQRPEIDSAMREIKAGAVRLNMARHEMLPMLNMVTRAYLSGLQGESDVADAWVDQFTEGAPSYSIGFQYEIPVGNRAARARLNRRLIEARQLQEQYRAALETVKAEVEIAVRELETAYQELGAKQRSLNAANSEAQTIEARWQRVVGGEGSASLNLESLLRAQERVTETESELLTAQLTYNLALVNLRRANGTLLEVEQIDAFRECDGGVPNVVLEKGASLAAVGSSFFEHETAPALGSDIEGLGTAIDSSRDHSSELPAKLNRENGRHLPIDGRIFGENVDARFSRSNSPVLRTKQSTGPSPNRIFPSDVPQAHTSNMKASPASYKYFTR